MLSIFSCVFWPSIGLLWRHTCLFRSFPHFLIGLFLFLALSWMSCLLILEINPLSVVSLVIQLSSVTQSSDSVSPWTAARQASLSNTNCRSLPKAMSIESVMPSNHIILCHPLLLLPLIFSSSRIFSNESALCIRWPKHWSFSLLSHKKEHIWVSSSEVDEPRAYYTEWSKSERER